jgi:predicted PurR-regulated permease PerM
VLVLATLAVLAALYYARDIIVPVVLALLLALLLRPVQRRMKRLRVPNFISGLILIGLVVTVFLGGVLTLTRQAQQWLTEAPAMVERVSKMLPVHSGPLSDLERTTAAVKDLTRGDNSAEPVEVELKSQDAAYAVLGVSSHFVAASIVVFVVGYFLLALSDTLLRQAVAARQSFFEKRTVVELLQNVEMGISRYLLTITVINVGLGIVTSLTMWLLRIPNPVLWGVMVATLNYVPHVGAFICMVVLFFVGSVTHESIGYGALVAGAFIALTSIESYFVTPLVLSKSLQLSPLAVILAILFFGWMWGIPGGLMAAPLLAVVKIACDRLQFNAVAALLGGESVNAAPEPHHAGTETSSEDDATRRALRIDAAGPGPSKVAAGSRTEAP